MMTAACLSLLLPLLASAQDPPPPRPVKPDLADLSLDELLKVEVTSVSRKAERLMDAAAAVYVIRGEDLRRTGTTSIADALRMVPGMDVARVNSNTWAVSARGFNARFANKLQVLVDGRSAYSPTYAGVYWDTLDGFLPDIERIEVIRGPGGTLWGANAVNGVVNVITKRARDTHGMLAYAGAGSLEEGFAGARYGGKAGDDVHYRAYAKAFQRDEFTHGEDQWWQGRGGFRVEWLPNAEDVFTVIGNAYTGEVHEAAWRVDIASASTAHSTIHNETRGADLVLRWERVASPTSGLLAQLTLDHYERDSRMLRDRRDTMDLDVQYRFTPLAGHDVIAGAGYSLAGDNYGNSFEIQFLPEEETDDVVSAFLQDEISLVDQVLKLTLGSKFEHNDYTGLEVQPNARLFLKVAEDHTLWAAASRAVHTPPRASDSVRVNLQSMPSGPPPAPAILASYTMVTEKSESVNTYELGYRGQIGGALSLDATGFYNLYDRTSGHRQSMSFETDPAPPHVLVLTEEGNFLSGVTWGAELAATWKPLEALTLQANYAYLRMDFRADDPGAEASEQVDREAPRHQIWVRSSLNLPHGLELDVVGRYVNQRAAIEIGSVTEMDVRLGWRITPNAELSLVGQNLLHRSHEEINDPLNPEVLQVPRSVYLSLNLRF